MAPIQLALDAGEPKTLFADNNPMRMLLERVLKEILEAEVADHVGAECYERTAARRAYRHSHRLRRLTTRVGLLTLRVPQTRDGAFSLEFLFKGVPTMLWRPFV